MPRTNPQKLISLSVSDDPKERLKFAKKIAELSNILSVENVRNQLLPFILDWIDINDEQILKAITRQIIYLAIKMGGIAYVSPLIMLCLTAEKKFVRDSLVEQIIQFKEDATAFQFMNAMVRSTFDSVRAFIPRVVNILSDPGDVQKVLLHLARDPSFNVRLNVLQSLSNQNSEIAKSVVTVLLNDLDDQMRSYVTAATINFPFYINSILPMLENDPSWRVRASVASNLGKCQPATSILSSLYNLSRDPSWEVRLLALRTLSKLIVANPQIKFEETAKLLHDITKGMSKNAQKSSLIAYTDAVVAILCSDVNRPEESVWSPIVDSLLNIQSAPVRIHLFIAAAMSKVTIVSQLLSPKFLKLLPLFIRDRKYKIREEAAKNFLLFREFFENRDIRKLIDESAINLLNDEANPVRAATAYYISQTIEATAENPMPKLVNDLARENSFRKRQNAILILHHMINTRQIPEVKAACEKLLDEIKSDSISIVRSFAENPIF